VQGPERWSSSVRNFVLVGLGLLLLGLLWYARELISPLIFAALLAYVLNPAVDVLTRQTRLSRRASVLLVYWTSLALVIVTLGVLIPALLGEARTLAIDLQRIVAQLRIILARPVLIFGWVFRLDRLLPDLTELSIGSLTPFPESILRLIESTSRNLAWVLVILVTPYYLLQDWERLRDWLIRLAPEAYQPEFRQLFQEVSGVWRAYLRGQLAVMFVVAVIFSFAWAAIGLPGALILGILTGLFSLVPELGPAVAGILAVLVALIEGSFFLPLSSFWFAVLVTVLYLVLINFKNIWLRPRLLGRSVHLHEGLVFVAIIAALVLGGILGGLIIVPVMASVGVIGRYVRRRLHGLQPFPDSPASVATADQTDVQSILLEGGEPASLPPMAGTAVPLPPQQSVVRAE